MAIALQQIARCQQLQHRQNSTTVEGEEEALVLPFLTPQESLISHAVQMLQKIQWYRDKEQTLQSTA